MIDINDIEQYIEDNAVRISKYVYLGKKTKKDDINKIRCAKKKVHKWLDFCVRAKPLLDMREITNELQVISFLQAVILDDASEKFDYTFYRYENYSKHMKRVQAALKNDDCEGVENVCNDRDEEFAKIIIWTLGCDRISANQLKQKFFMGNRANHIMDRLCELKIVDGKFANQPRKVVPVCSGDLSPATICILERYGYDLEYIEDVFRGRNEQKNVTI